ncbi:hypothetical protein [Catenulispora pinisilvae]|uniref:hypothetical protein n=2 Tax=Catenulispora TaxID=414878 RepID=UPI0018927764|nr:hypothetical protein [Catenulispora pinisilvae]
MVAECLAKDPDARPAPTRLLELWGTATTLTADWLPTAVNTSLTGSSAITQAMFGTDGAIAYLDQGTSKLNAFGTVGLNNTGLSDTSVAAYLAASPVDTAGGGVVVNPAAGYANPPRRTVTRL